MKSRGRIPGRKGLWEVSHDGSRVSAMSCVDAGFSDSLCRWITPGLFDLQVNGIGGINFTDPGLTVDRLVRADALIRDRGIERYCPTLITCSRETAFAVMDIFNAAWRQGVVPAAWGLHLEGPWISPEDGYRGVHRLEHVRAPSVDELDGFQERCEGRIRLLTVAPETAGSEELIRRAVRAGMTVSLGHTNASAADIERAVRAGARMSTHLFNGCARLVDRHRNPILAQLAEDALYACFIADGHHVPFPTLRVGLRAKGPSRSILVSDIAPISGLPDGEYVMEGNAVEMRDGGVWVKGSWMLSGAARTLDQDVELLAREGETDIEQALLMATANPAAAVGDPAWAAIVPGRAGPLVVFSWDGRRLAREGEAGL